MTLGASEFQEAGTNLPSAVREDVAPRLLETVEPNETFDMAAEE